MLHLRENPREGVKSQDLSIKTNRSFNTLVAISDKRRRLWRDILYVVPARGFNIDVTRPNKQKQIFRFSCGETSCDFPTVYVPCDRHVLLTGSWHTASASVTSRRKRYASISVLSWRHFNKEHCRCLRNPRPLPTIAAIANTQALAIGTFSSRLLRSRLISIYIRYAPDDVFTRAGNCARPRIDRSADRILRPGRR